MNNSSGSSVDLEQSIERKDALGVVWILAATNFPFMRTIIPLAGALVWKYSQCAAPD